MGKIDFNVEGFRLGEPHAEMDARLRLLRAEADAVRWVKYRLNNLPGSYLPTLKPDDVYYAWDLGKYTRSRNPEAERGSLPQYVGWLVGADEDKTIKRFRPFGEHIKKSFIGAIGEVAPLCYPQLHYLWLLAGGDPNQSTISIEGQVSSIILAESVLFAPENIQEQLPNSFEISGEQVTHYRGLIGRMINPLTAAMGGENSLDNLIAQTTKSRKFKVWQPIVREIRDQFVALISSELRGKNDPFKLINGKWYYQPERLIRPLNKLIAFGAISLEFWPGVLAHIADTSLQDANVPVSGRDQIINGFVNAGLEQELRQLVRRDKRFRFDW